MTTTAAVSGDDDNSALWQNWSPKSHHHPFTYPHYRPTTITEGFLGGFQFSTVSLITFFNLDRDEFVLFVEEKSLSYELRGSEDTEGLFNEKKKRRKELHFRVYFLLFCVGKCTVCNDIKTY